VPETEDDPEAYFRRFLEEIPTSVSSSSTAAATAITSRSHRFLLFQGELDIEVNFRANFSTRRLNLESAEFALESVKLHLQFLEEPALEDTSFYQEGLVILYDPG